MVRAVSRSFILGPILSSWVKIWSSSCFSTIVLTFSQNPLQMSVTLINLVDVELIKLPQADIKIAIVTKDVNKAASVFIAFLPTAGFFAALSKPALQRALQ